MKGNEGNEVRRIIQERTVKEYRKKKYKWDADTLEVIDWNSVKKL